MRLVFKENKQIEFLKDAIKTSNSKTIKHFSTSISVRYSTFKNWFHGKRLLPKNIFDKILQLYPSLKKYEDYIIELKDDSWGAKLGGKKTYKIILNKYGLEEIRKRQIKGGYSKKRLGYESKSFKINFNDALFLEFYGALLGDGWISIFTNKVSGKKIRFIGFSGHIKNDKEYLIRIKNITKKLFSRDGYMRDKLKYNTVEFTFGHIDLINLLHNELNFPIGLKINLKIDDRFLKDWNLSKYIIRGLFDTDGCLFFDKDPRYKSPYPVIDITTNSKELRNQLKQILDNNHYKVILNAKGIRIKGVKQMIKWFKEIEPKNKRHLLKYENYILKYASVAQSG